MQIFFFISDYRKSIHKIFSTVKFNVNTTFRPKVNKSFYSDGFTIKWRGTAEILKSFLKLSDYYNEVVLILTWS